MLTEAILRIRDENGIGGIFNEFDLHFRNVKITIRDIITERVHLEVKRYNKKADGYRFALVSPTHEELLLNGSKTKSKGAVDPEKQVAAALEGFSKNVFFILVDDVQAEELDQVVTIRPDTRISFIKLTPLVGG